MVVASTVASDKKSAGYHWEKDMRGHQRCSDRNQKRKAAMSFSNIIVVETYLGYYPVISKPREDVR